MTAPRPLPLPQAFLQRPLAHRGLHGAGVPENSMAGCAAAIAADYGIEIDVQLSADGQAMVFHDETLDRMTAQSGRVDARSAAALGALQLGDTAETIPTLAELLDLVEGRAALLIEIKDQEGALGPTDERLEAAVAAALAGYGGPAAVMSFNPFSMRAFGAITRDWPLGLTTCSFAQDDWPEVPAARRDSFAGIAEFQETGASFISHDRRDLGNPAVAALKSQGVPILCWTVRSEAEEAAARRVADNITFEGYAAP